MDFNGAWIKAQKDDKASLNTEIPEVVKGPMVENNFFFFFSWYKIIVSEKE